MGGVNDVDGSLQVLCQSQNKTKTSCMLLPVVKYSKTEAFSILNEVTPQ